jgi:nitrate reductase gamma subunit
MTVIESLDRLRDRYIEWYKTSSQMNNYKSSEDAQYTWWEREKDCQQWCNKEKTYVQMSDTKTLKIMREWFKKCKQQ